MEGPFMIVEASHFGTQRALELNSTPYLIVFKQDMGDPNSPFKLVCAAPNKTCAEDVLLSLNTQMRINSFGGGPIFEILEAIKDLNAVMFNFTPDKQKDTTIASGVEKIENKLLEEFEEVEDEFEDTEIEDTEIEETKEDVKDPKDKKVDKPKFH